MDIHAQKLKGALSDYLWVNVLIRRMNQIPELIRGPRKDAEYVEVRRALATQLRSEGWSLPRIGKALKRDHSSVIWMLRGGRGTKKCA